MSKILSPVLGLVGMARAPKAVDRATGHSVAGSQAAQAALDPYMQTGTQANTMLQNKLSSGALGGSFAPGDLTQDPGYKFRLQEGEQALGRKQSAGGNYYSGEALKEAQQYGQGLADQTYNDAYNRWLKEQQNTYNILSGQQGQGRSAATGYGGYATDIGNTMAQSVIEKENQRMKGLADVLGGFGG